MAELLMVELADTYGGDHRIVPSPAGCVRPVISESTYSTMLLSQLRTRVKRPCPASNDPRSHQTTALSSAAYLLLLGFRPTNGCMRAAVILSRIDASVKS